MIRAVLTLLILCFGVPATARAEFSSCFTTNCHRAIASLKNLHQPVKDKDCLACHVRRAATHPILVGGGRTFELVAPGAKLCEKCHDAMGKKKVVHKPVREGNCLACHKPHGASGPFLLDVTDDQTPLCLGCHDKTPFRQKFLHGPVATGKCTECHDPHESADTALLPGKSRELCLRCHADFAKAMAAAPIRHQPVDTSPCTSCHSPHSSTGARMLKKDMPLLCVYCHDGIEKKLKEAKVGHKPVVQGESCVSCHSPHFSREKGLLQTEEKPLCLGCHGNDTLGSPPLANIRKELDGKKDLHAPLQKSICSACHDPHGSRFSHILKGEYPMEFYAPYREGSYDFCLSCHDRSLLRFPDTTIYTRFRNGNRNLHYVHVVNKRKGRTCRACHEPHASDGQKLVDSKGSRFGGWRIPSRLTITPTGGSCAPGCHRKFAYDREKPVNYDEEQKN